MAFKLPDIEDVEEDENKKKQLKGAKTAPNSESLKDEDTNEFDKKDSESAVKLPTSLNIDNNLDSSDKESDDDQDINDLPELTDEAVDNVFSSEETDDEPVTSEVSKLTGTINQIKKDDKQFIIILNLIDSDKTVFLVKERTFGNLDGVLSHLNTGAKITITYNDDETKQTESNVDVYFVLDVINISNTEPPKSNPDSDYYDEPEESNFDKDYNKTKDKYKSLISLNDKIGDKIFYVLAILGNFLIKIPFIGKLLEKTKPIWKILCRFWLIVSIILLFLLLFLRTLPNNKATYDVKTSDISITLSNVKYSHNSNEIILTAKNNSKINSYYYLTGSVTKKGLLPFSKKIINCAGPSIGQKLNSTTTIHLKCALPGLTRATKYNFDIYNNN